MTRHIAFWDDLASDLEDPAFLRAYLAESMRIATVDAVINAIDGAREVAGLSKAELARAIRKDSATIRRLLSSANPNPTLGTLAEVAAALGLRITVEPLSQEEREQVTRPLLDGHSADRERLARYLADLRAGHENARVQPVVS